MSALEDSALNSPRVFLFGFIEEVNLWNTPTRGYLENSGIALVSPNPELVADTPEEGGKNTFTG